MFFFSTQALVVLPLFSPLWTYKDKHPLVFDNARQAASIVARPCRWVYENSSSRSSIWTRITACRCWSGKQATTGGCVRLQWNIRSADQAPVKRMTSWVNAHVECHMIKQTTKQHVKTHNQVRHWAVADRAIRHSAVLTSRLYVLIIVCIRSSTNYTRPVQQLLR